MRNVFDQYEQPENRLTHALLSSLDADRKLLAHFCEWVTGSSYVNRALYVLEQSLPGDESLPIQEGDRKGIPDGCITDGGGWAILIESKLVSYWIPDQLRRHRASAERRDLNDITILCLTVGQSAQSVPKGCVAKTWSEVYAWLQTQIRFSEWARRCHSYFEIAEAQLIERNGLTAGAITMFSGIPFDKEQPYSYVQAKRVLGLLRARLLEDKELIQVLAVDVDNPGRGAITGTKGRLVWDFIGFDGAKGTNAFTAYPHLTIGVLDDRLEAMLTVPNGVAAGLRKLILGQTFEDFEQRVLRTCKAMVSVEKIAPGGRPLIHIVQRHYPSQRATGIQDASLRFDPRTGIGGNHGRTGGVKLQPQWLSLSYEVLDKRKSNIQFQIGMEFLYNTCETVRTEQIAVAVAQAWRACTPFLEEIGTESSRQG